MSYYKGTTGGGERLEMGFGADDSVLDHSLIPFRGSTVYLRLVNSTKLALDYAAGGFHVSVARGLMGGCKDQAVTYSAFATAAVKGEVTCSDALNRSDIRDAWATAAEAYKDAYANIESGTSLANAKAQLAMANSYANQAYKAEGVTPPSDPQTGAVEPPQMLKMGMPWWLLPATLLGAALVFGKKSKHGKKHWASK